MMLPKVALVSQKVNTDHIHDIKTHVSHQLDSIFTQKQLKPGMKVALAVGSRGISCLLEVVQTVVLELNKWGVESFIVPAMGSHGGATADGQREVLLGYGLSLEKVGIPIVSSMDVIEIGRTPLGNRVYFDANAAEADGIIVINRIKEHTAFKARWESGLIKMLSVGLGKAIGAAEIHAHGYPDSITESGRIILASMPILAGIGIIENGIHEPAEIVVLRAEEIESMEPALLEKARAYLPKIPLESLDLLLIKEMGKNISGTGIDLNVVGMWRRCGGMPDPIIKVLAVLDITPESYGNAIGVGHADLITKRLRDMIDIKTTYTNCLTSHNLAGGKIPITLENDKEILEKGLLGVQPDQARLVMIKNTLELSSFWVSESLLEDVSKHPQLEQLTPAIDIPFDEKNNITIGFSYDE